MSANVKGPAIFLAQFAGDAAPFNSFDAICKWAASLGYKGVQIPTWEARLFDLAKAAEQLRAIPPVQRRHVAELVRSVCDANNAFDLEEERFLLGFVLALSLSREDVADLVVHPAPGIDGHAKRIFDVLFSGTGVALGWPLGLAIGLAVRLTSPGPALYKQPRYGQHGEEILVWKFRTMRVTEETKFGTRFTSARVKCWPPPPREIITFLPWLFK